MPYYQVSGEDYGGIWVKLGVIGGQNSRKPLLGFGCQGERNFVKVSACSLHHDTDGTLTLRPPKTVPLRILSHTAMRLRLFRRVQ